MIPIYKADTIDGKEVEGYYYKMINVGRDTRTPYIISKDLTDPEFDDYFEINPDTLKISFDGESWYKIEEVAARIKFVEDNAITIWSK